MHLTTRSAYVCYRCMGTGAVVGKLACSSCLGSGTVAKKADPMIELRLIWHSPDGHINHHTSELKRLKKGWPQLYQWIVDNAGEVTPL